MRETPTITGYSHTHSTYSGDPAPNLNFMAVAPAGFRGITQATKMVQDTTEEMTIRIVRVFIIDTDESLDLESRVLYRGNEKLTDLNDQELFFELPINDILVKHNTMRIKTVDKMQSAKYGKDMYLEAARIRDLRMSVVTIAQF